MTGESEFKSIMRLTSCAKFILRSALVVCIITSSANAETIRDALARAYLWNPQLNAQRANTRAVDEQVPIAQGSFLPTATVTGNYGMMQQDLLSSRSKSATLTEPGGANLIVSMNIFSGFRGVNGVNQAQAQVFQSRQFLRNIELTVLSNAANAYLNLHRDIAIYELRDQFVSIMKKQVEITYERMTGGEVTMTDVHQVETLLASAKEQRATAIINLQSSIAVYKQIIGQTPTKLYPAEPLDKLLPKSLEDALRRAEVDHPLAVAARYNVDIQEYAVKIVEGQLLPTVNFNGQFGQQYNYFGTAGQRFFQGSAGLQVSVPLYEGGVVYGQTRQAKEKLGEARFLQDQQIYQVRQALESAWAAWKQSGVFLAAAKEQVRKAEETLAGMREEAKFGQRITLEILTSEQALVNARVNFVTGQRDRIFSTYNTLAAIGELSSSTLGIDAPQYQPTDHYNRVKNQFIGLEPWR